ncbi:Hypothetical Protein FCC1311_077952, partial [Hondaea fermentalgiana]
MAGTKSYQAQPPQATTEAIKAGAAEDADSDADASQEVDDEDPRLIRTVADFTAAFGFGENNLKKLPSVHDRNQGQLPADDPRLRIMVNNIVPATVRMAELVYLGDPSILQRLVGEKLTGSTDKTRELPYWATTLIIRVASKGSIQGRTARAVLVKGVSTKTLEELRKTNVIPLGGLTHKKARKDYHKAGQGASRVGSSVVNSSAKKGPAQMRERLMDAVPTARYSPPSVAEIKTRISAFVMDSKGNTSGMVQETRRTTGKRGRKSKVPDEVQRFLDERASANPNIKPRDVVKAIRERFPDLVGIDGVALDVEQLERAFTAAKKRQQSSN